MLPLSGPPVEEQPQLPQPGLNLRLGVVSNHL